jgi:hypothetical protein
MSNDGQAVLDLALFWIWRGLALQYFPADNFDTTIFLVFGGS